MRFDRDGEFGPCTRAAMERARDEERARRARHARRQRSRYSETRMIGRIAVVLVGGLTALIPVTIWPGTVWATLGFIAGVALIARVLYVAYKEEI